MFDSSNAAQFSNQINFYLINMITMVDVKIGFWLLICFGLIAVGQGAAPGNDLCQGAIDITDTGAATLSPSSVDVTDATISSSDPNPTCLSSTSSISRSIWWTFTPTTTEVFTFSTCSDTSTTLPDTVLLLLTGTCDNTTQVPRGCSDNACSKQSKFIVSLTANTKYYIAVYSGSTDIPALGVNSVQVKITRGGNYLPAAANDKCQSAVSVTLNSTTELPQNVYWSDDYTYTSDCFRDTSVKALGNGGDIVYKFTPPADGNYNFRVISRPGIVAQDVAIVMATECVASGTKLAYPKCSINGVNRRTDFIELNNCHGLNTGIPVYIIIDLVNPDTNTLIDTSVQYYLEVSLCNAEYEASSINDAAAITCGVTGGLDQTISDNSDYFYLGQSIEQDAVLFVLVDGGAATVGGFQLTLLRTDGSEVQSFPADNNPIWGMNSSSIVGYRLPATSNYYIRIDSAQEKDVPYQIWSWYERSFSTPNSESEPNSNIATASSLGQYGIGQLTGTDVDYWKIDVPAQGSFAPFVTACLAPQSGQTTLAAGLKLVFRNSSGDSILSIDGGSRGRCMNIRPLNSGQFYFSVEASGNSGGYILAVSYDCAPSNQAGIPSTPIGSIPSGNAPSVTNAPKAPLSLVLPIAPLGSPTKSVSLANGLSASYTFVLLSLLVLV